VVVVTGLTEIDAPVPTDTPPQLPLYQCHEAPVPRVPPFIVSVLELPEHIVDGEAVAEVAAVEFEFTFTVTETHVVVLHVPSART
jgi:hypothetical protein